MAWWEHFRLAALPADELVDEQDGVGGLEFVERVHAVLHKKTHKPTGSVVDRYRYPLQETEVGRGPVKQPGGEAFGKVVSYDRVARTLDIQKGKDLADVHAPALFQSEVIGTADLQKSLLRLCDRVDETGSGTDLLHRRAPRLAGTSLDARPGESLVDGARRLALHLDRTTLAVQGPPGSGKTYLGAQMIRALVVAGKRVGVVAPSHKVIVNLLEAVAAQATGGRRSRAPGPQAGQRRGGGRRVRGWHPRLQQERRGARGPHRTRGRCPWRHGLDVVHRELRPRGGRPRRGRSGAVLAGQCARRVTGGREPGAARRSAATAAAAEGQPSGRRGRVSAAARARPGGRGADDGGRPRPVPAGDVADGAGRVCVHVRAVLRGQAAPAPRPRTARPGRQRQTSTAPACGGCRWRTKPTATGPARRSRRWTRS